MNVHFWKIITTAVGETASVVTTTVVNRLIYERICVSIFPLFGVTWFPPWLVTWPSTLPRTTRMRGVIFVFLKFVVFFYEPSLYLSPSVKGEWTWKLKSGRPSQSRQLPYKVMPSTVEFSYKKPVTFYWAYLFSCSVYSERCVKRDVSLFVMSLEYLFSISTKLILKWCGSGVVTFPFHLCS